MTDVLRLVRAHNLIVAAGGVLAGGWIALGVVTIPKLLTFAAVAAAGFGASGYALNGLLDADADRVNRRPADRPFAAGRVSRGAAELCVAGGAAVGLAAAALVSGTAVLVGFAALAVMIAYSPVLKPRGVVGNVAVALVAGLPLLYGALAVGRPAQGLVPWTLAAWIHVMREVVKDIEDEAGDRLVGRRTLPVRLGARGAALVAGGLGIAFLPASIALPLAARYRGAYYVIALWAQVPVLLVAARLMAGKMRGNSLVLKGAMLAGLVALVAGRVT